VNDREIAGHANILTVGSDLHYDTSTIDSHGSGSYYGYPYAYANRWDFDRTSLGGYGKDEFFLTETLSLALGARAEYINNRIVKGRSTTSDSDAEKAYDAALLYRPSDQVKVFTRVARYYHAPFIDEIFPGSGVPNTDLVPETGYDYEVGTEVAINKEWTVGLTAYELDANNEIYFDPKAKGYGANVNSPDDTRRRGIESSLRWKREQAGSFGVNYDYTDSAFTEGLYEGNTVPLVPEHMLTVQGEVCLTPELAALATVSYVSSQHSGSDFANAKDKLDDYGTLDLAVRYEPAFLKGLNVIAGVDNVFDREYAYSSFYGTTYYPATDRTWKLCASYSF
jgi:iron complex outermembrane receptor protein